MNRTLTAICLSTLLATSAPADRYYANLHRTYDQQKAALTSEYHAQRHRLRADYRANREALLAQREYIARIDCHKTRSARLRANSNQLTVLARENGQLNRQLSRWYSDSMRTLRQDFEYARDSLKRERRARQIVESRSVYARPTQYVDELYVPPTRAYVVADEYDFAPARPRYDRHDVVRQRRPNGLDIAAAIINLLQ